MATLSPPLTFLTITFIILTAASSSPPLSSSSSVSEIEILLKFKSKLNDPSNVLSNWSSNSPLHHCNWTGVQCFGGPFSQHVVGINLDSANLSGEISSSICDLPHLTGLALEINQFKTPFPDIVKCKSLRMLYLYENQFYGEIPDWISELSSLVEFDMESNKIEAIPQSIGLIKTLKWLNLHNNNLSGSIADNVLGNLSELIMLDLSENPSLVSELPRDIGKLVNLRDIYFHGCGFHGVIPESYNSGLPGLENLDLSRNNLTGMIPKSLVLDKNWATFDVSQNSFFGSLPIGNVFNKGLLKFSVHSNMFNGSLPKGGIDKCLNLETFQVQNNDFEGDFLNGVWSLPSIKVIRAENNRFTGEIPESVSKAAYLQEVKIDNNNFTGVIPGGLGMIKSLYRFSASSNGFIGEIPSRLCHSSAISTLNLSHNSLHGNIPEMKKCRKLVSLSLADNRLVGEIPPSLGNLPGLTYIDLSNNYLTGSIPQELQKLNMSFFDVSFNQLSGRVPSFLILRPQASVYLQGNGGLCGFGLPNSCSESDPLVGLLFITVLPVIAFVIVFMVVIIIIYEKFVAKPQKGVWKSHRCFDPPILTMDDLITGMNEKNARGIESSFGRYYVISTPSNGLVAVKKLVKPPTSSSIFFNAKIKKLAKIKHENIAKILGLWYSDKEVIIIYEYAQRGSLGDLLSKPGFELSWEARLKIAVRVAQALEYLHKDCTPRVLHRNVKSNNILLNDDCKPMLTDFALDRIIGEVEFRSCMHSFRDCRASSCYMAPENWGAKKATEKMDMYSFGVVLLELVTGKQAEQTKSKNSLDIVQWVLRKILEEPIFQQVIDPNISDSPYKAQMFGALEIALCCASVVPNKRPSSMSDVVKELLHLPVYRPGVLSIVAK